MCGICFICGPGLSASCLLNQAQVAQHLLKRRGPDLSFQEVIRISDKCNGLFWGNVLWLQGSVPVKQPVMDCEGNVLLWNGDILSGYEIPKEHCDTDYIFSKLQESCEAVMFTFISKIKGPWSFIYYSKKRKRLYFGRDMFGRHSLLWRIPENEHCQSFILSSVHCRDMSFKEVVALGIYYIDVKDFEDLNSFKVNLVPWTCVSEESLLNIDSYINVLSERIHIPIWNKLNCMEPTFEINKTLKLCSITETSVDFEKLYEAMKNEVCGLLQVLKCAVQRRVAKCPDKCQDCTFSSGNCDHAKVAVLFSGGLDSAVIALLLHDCLPEGESIDLLNVAFEQKSDLDHIDKVQRKNEKYKKEKVNEQIESGSSTVNTNKVSEEVSKEKWNVPDRLSGLKCLEQLQTVQPNRKWNFVEINISKILLEKMRADHIHHLVAPLSSVLDDSIGCAIWFGGHGTGSLRGEDYHSPARVLLCGMGADEQLGGYSRHRSAFEQDGWLGLAKEVTDQVARIHTRNLGRDNRVLADHGRAPRFPYLDEDVVAFLNDVPLWKKANLYLRRGVGEKLLLRVLAAHLGLTFPALLPKRAIQFGSRIAKLENSKEKGGDVCERLQRIHMSSREPFHNEAACT